MNKKSGHNVLYLHGRPMAHPMHLALAKSVGSDLYPVDRHMRWQDTNKTVVYRAVSWIVNAFTYPVRWYSCILVDNLHFSPVISKKLGLLGDRKIIVHLGSHTLYFMYANRFSPWVNKMHRYALKNYDALLCEGKMAAELVDKILGAAAPPTYVTYLGVPLARWEKLNRLQPNLLSKTIIIIANGPSQFREWYKGLDVMIQAFAIAHERDEALRLRVIGAWNKDIMQANLTSLDEKTKVSVSFTGKVNNIDFYLKESALCLHCTRGDAFPTSTLEAMAAGVVPLVSSFTGTKEVMRKVDEQFIVPLDTGKIADAITRYFAFSDQEKKVLSDRCRTVVQDYTEERSVVHYQETFRKVGNDLGAISNSAT